MLLHTLRFNWRRRYSFRWTSFHDDVIKWKHFPRNWPFVRGIHRSPVNSLHKGQWRGALMFSLMCVWINDWVNNGEAGDLRRYCIHYDVTVIFSPHWQCFHRITITSHVRHVVSNHRSFYCLLSSLSGPISKKRQSPYYWPFVMEFTGDRWISRTKANNAEKASIWWLYHADDSSLDVVMQKHVIGKIFRLNMSLFLSSFDPRPPLSWNDIWVADFHGSTSSILRPHIDSF